MKKHEKVIFLLVLAQVVVFAGLYRAHSATTLTSVQPPQVLKVLPQPLIGNQKELAGSRHASYTLVEFGDYQCPPCAQMSAQVKFLLEEYPDKLRFRFRHYPLEIHEYAMNGALIAEKARALGRLWEVHDRLYELKTKLSPDRVTQLMSQLKLDTGNLSTQQNREAEKRVQADIKLADAFGLTSTPTFLLCCPDGRVLKLDTLAQANLLLQ